MANRTSTASSSRANEEVTYFDLISTGIGYLNRIRDVHPDTGDSYTCCKINAIVGPSNKVTYREIDLRVVGTQALEALDVISAATPDKDAKIVVAFRMGDAEPSSYVIQVTDDRGNQRPKTRYTIKSRLLKITSCKINGEPIELPGLDEDASVPGDQEFGADADQQASRSEEQPRSSTPHHDEPEQPAQLMRSAPTRRTAPAQRSESTPRRSARVAA